MDVLGFLTLLVTGFTACAQFGSYALAHPAARKLPARERIAFEQGQLRTYGRVTPVLLTVSLLLAVAYAWWAGGEGGPSGWRWLAVVAIALASGVTVVFNVPVNHATYLWEPGDPPSDWREQRERWELYHGLRSWLLLLAFALLAAGFATG